MTDRHGAGRHPAHGDLDAAEALGEETAAALGRAGHKLQEAVARYHASLADGGASSDDEAVLLDEVTRCTYKLLVQRECAGARTANLSTIAHVYQVPHAALRRL